VRYRAPRAAELLLRDVVIGDDETGLWLRGQGACLCRLLAPPSKRWWRLVVDATGAVLEGMTR
jgi:hypothetical protein